MRLLLESPALDYETLNQRCYELNRGASRLKCTIRISALSP